MEVATTKLSVNDKRETFGWAMYDWANSAFSTTVGTVFLGPYLASLATVAAKASRMAWRIWEVFQSHRIPSCHIVFHSLWGCRCSSCQSWERSLIIHTCVSR